MNVNNKHTHCYETLTLTGYQILVDLVTFFQNKFENMKHSL